MQVHAGTCRYMQVHAGTCRAANIAMLGAAAGIGVLPFPEEILQAVLDTEIPEKHRAVNRTAFEHAMKLVSDVS